MWDQPNGTINSNFEDGLQFLWSSKVLGYLATPCYITKPPSNMHILRRSLAKDLASQSGSNFFSLQVALAMSCIMVAWICILLTSQFFPNFCKKCSSVCSFQQPYYTRPLYGWIYTCCKDSSSRNILCHFGVNTTHEGPSPANFEFYSSWYFLWMIVKGP